MKERRFRASGVIKAATVPDDTGGRAAIAILAAFAIVCLLVGGSSQVNGGGPALAFILRPWAVLSLAALLLLPGPLAWCRVRVPLLLLGALALTMVIQLVPLPPAAWAALPGHGRFMEAAAAAGLPQPWRPISIAPELTLNSLIALVVPATVLIGIARLPRPRLDQLVWWAIAATLVSAILGVLQWAGPSDSPLQFYGFANRDLPTGLLANRNHQALFLAMALPLLRVWVAQPGSVVRDSRVRTGLAVLIGIFFLPVIIATGSRTGLLIMIVALASAWLIAPVSLPQRQPRSRMAMAAVGLAAAAVVLLMVTIVATGRAVSINRLLAFNDASSELRVRFTPLMLRITGDFLPFGTGYGAFDRAFRIYEPLAFLQRTYFNHAHDDILELVMTGGIPALLVLLVFAVWIARRGAAVLAYRRRRRVGAGGRLRGAGLAIILLCFIGSVPDYPLRAPIMAMMFAFACALVALPRQPAETIPES